MIAIPTSSSSGAFDKEEKSTLLHRKAVPRPASHPHSSSPAFPLVQCTSYTTARDDLDESKPHTNEEPPGGTEHRSLLCFRTELEPGPLVGNGWVEREH